MDTPEIQKYIKHGRELAEHFKESVEKRYPDAAVTDYSAVSAVLSCNLLVSTFISIAEAAGPQRAEDWFMSVMGDFAQGVEKELNAMGVPIKISVTSLFAKQGGPEADSGWR